MRGFGTKILAYDPVQNQACLDIGVQYVDVQTLYSEADIISLHCPLTDNSFHMINEAAINHMKHGVMLINTSRGRTIDTKAVVQALKSGKIAHLGIDVYEEEGDLFFENLSDQVIQDDVFARLTTFPNVIITGHQAYFTEEAVRNIAQTTIANISAFEQGKGEIFIVDINQLS
jgi:D-lactate dehydrogenase